jgi:manganese-dependent inorganic pyrophosphatase
MGTKVKEEICVVGHKQPDSDSICSAIAYSYFLKKKGKNAIPFKLGEINPETKYILDYFKIRIPETLKTAKEKTLILLDHNEKEQAVDDADKAKILEVIDHHKISFSWPEPIYFLSEPVGATSTIIAKKFFQENVKIPRKIAGILLAGILSDTAVFRSPTTTEEDVQVAKKLAKIAKIKDIEKFGIEVKKKKTTITGQKAEDVIFSDFKIYDFSGKKVGIGQVEVFDFDEVEKRKEELIEKLKEICQKENYNLLLLVLTNILKKDSQVLAAGEVEYLEKAFGKKVVENTVYLPGVMSRKKQIVPPLMKAFQGS